MYNNSEREAEHLKGLYGVVEDGMPRLSIPIT